MKVKTSASEFRALVQELTGQNAESPPDPSRFHDQEPQSDDGGGGRGSGGGYKMNISENCLMKINGHDDENDFSLVVPPKVDPNNYCQGQSASGGSSMESFEPFDDVFTPEMIENISAMLPESVFYESLQVDHIRC